MSNLVGPNNKPIPAVAEGNLDEEETPKNGKSDGEMLDIRAVPVGTLVYNLIIATFDERMTGMAVQQMSMMKEAQKMVQDPPQLAQAKEEFAVHEQRRYAMATELNNRFYELDTAYVESLGLEVVDMAASSAPPAESKEDEDAPVH